MFEQLSYREIHQKLLEQYAPPSVIISEEYNILHMSPSVGRFLTIRGGEPSYNLLNIVLTELRIELRTTLYQAVQRGGGSVESSPPAVTINGKPQKITMIVCPAFGEYNPTR